MSKIVWIDMEMTGLNIHKDRIMEVACIVTDNNLNILAENDSIIIHQPDSLLDTMVDWCKATHARVGVSSDNFAIDVFWFSVFHPIHFIQCLLFSPFPCRRDFGPNVKNQQSPKQKPNKWY